MTAVLMFPGQSSRATGMLERICEGWPPARAIIAEASDRLDRDLVAHYGADNENAFTRNRDIQVGVFLCSYLHQQALADHGIEGDLSLGLSLGEYNHLVHVGALDFLSALDLVEARGEAYDEGPEGMMASIFPLPANELEYYLARVRYKGAVEIANLNSPGQNVIAGEHSAVGAAIALIEDEEPAVQAVVIEKRIPMHTPIFRSVAPALRRALDRAPWTKPAKPYLANVVGDFVPDCDSSTIADLLERHVYSPVLWRRSIDLIAERHPDATFIEVGPGSVLFNLLQTRWHANPKFRTDDPAGFAVGLRSFVASVAHDS